MTQIFKALFLLVLWSAVLPPQGQADEFLPTPEREPFLDSFLPTKSLSLRRTGLNAFANNPVFGSVSAQLRETRNSLGVRHLRVLFSWNDQVQQSPDSDIFWGFYDDIASSIPRGSKALVILTDVPSWMRQSQNWIEGDPRRTFVQRWVRKVVERYGRSRRIVGFQIWNEPNDTTSHNTILDLTSSPANYLQLLRESTEVVRRSAPRKKVVSAATTSINQNYPETFLYNEALISGGLETIADIYAIHYYGTNIERLLLSGGITDFLTRRTLPIWVTESGERGLEEQEDYARTMWPFLFETFPQIKRFYFYKFTDTDDGPEASFGLKHPSGNSDLYEYLAQKHASRRARRRKARRASRQ